MNARAPRHKALQALVATPRAAAAMQAQAGAVPDSVSAWLADLQVLMGVPFQYLVPDARMLPLESIRFFVVDPNWIAALTDGVLTLAARTAPAAAAVEALRPLALATARRVASERPRRRGGRRVAATDTGVAGALATDPAPPILAYSGFLLRSAAVADWPGLRVSGYADAQAATPALAIARLERVAPTILLALFAGLVQRVDIAKPGQHLHFGVLSANEQTVPLRWIDPARAGAQLSGDPTATVQCRPDPARVVLDVTATVASINQGLAAGYQPQPVPHLGAAAFSLQLLEATPTQSFQAGAAAPAASTPDPVTT